MADISPPSAQQPIVDPQRKMTQRFRTWANNITRLDVFIGSGSPEGVFPAQVGRFYVDVSGSSGSILYVKRDSGVGGDDSLGWILV